MIKRRLPKADGSALEWTDPDAAVWRGMRLSKRQRLAEAMQHLLANGSLNRADIKRIGEVSIPQASNDIAIMKARTKALIYDPSARHYTLKKRKKDSA